MDLFSNSKLSFTVFESIRPISGSGGGTFGLAWLGMDH